jgi:hypothetical protein
MSDQFTARSLPKLLDGKWPIILLRGPLGAWGSLTCSKFTTRFKQLKVPTGGLVPWIFPSWKIRRPPPWHSYYIALFNLRRLWYRVVFFRQYEYFGGCSHSILPLTYSLPWDCQLSHVRAWVTVLLEHVNSLEVDSYLVVLVFRQGSGKPTTEMSSMLMIVLSETPDS